MKGSGVDLAFECWGPMCDSMSVSIHAAQNECRHGRYLGSWYSSLWIQMQVMVISYFLKSDDW